MEKEELEKLLELLKKFQHATYPEDTGTSEEFDLNSVIGDVEFSLENLPEITRFGCDPELDRPNFPAYSHIYNIETGLIDVVGSDGKTKAEFKIF